MMFNRIKLRTNILLHFLLVLFILTVALIGIQYYFNQQLAKEAVREKFHQTAQKVALAMRSKDTLSKEVLYQIETHPAIDVESIDLLPKNTIRLFSATLKRYANMYAIYLGYPNGDFYEVVNMQVNALTFKRYHAPKETRWMVIKIYDHPQKGRIRSFTFFDNALRKLGSRDEPSSYYVTVRPWYQEALGSTRPVRSDPYMFSNFKVLGVTYSKRLKEGNTVLALDFPLQNIRQMLHAMKFSHTGDIYLFGRDGKVIASSDKAHPTLVSPLQTLIRQKRIGSMQSITAEGKRFYAMILPLTKEMGKETYIGVTIDRQEILSPFMRTIYYSLLLALIVALLLVPLTFLFADRITKPLKALMRENESIKRREFEEIRPIRSNIEEFIALSDSQIAMSESIQTYQKQMETLLDSFIRLIADTIDAKSPYTGSHCKKVPIIATMLANAAQKSEDIPFKTFRFKNEEERKAFERAAWLHDCGKITTPEYVVDKATKLETIYNRIHEIRTRFEVLWRDVDILYYERLLQGEKKADLARWREEEHHRLIEEFNFIASCNIGGESLDEKKITRIHKIAQRRWIRHFDNRIGLSPDELERASAKEEPLPVSEPLIADKPEHLVPRSGFDEEAYHQSGFTMEVPTYLYNRGEIYNLTLSKGTLTLEERFKINEHIIMTIKMLEALPFPENMRSIPRIAGEHHEKMDGTGYPRGLGSKDLSIPSRIMAIADIFEALTASDRPYKKAKPLSEALKIMYRMKREKHIDPDLFDLFLTSGVYLAYAQAHLDPEQIDDVDIDRYLG